MPRICPQKTEIEDKYKQHPHQGGWMATTITEEELDAEEPDFKDISVFQHEETLYLLDRLAEQYIRSPNRKSYVPGDVPNEAWRILLNDQWLIKGHTPKWGLGYNADEAGRETLRRQKKNMFPEPMLFKEQLMQLINVIMSSCQQGIILHRCSPTWDICSPKKFSAWKLAKK